MWVHVGRDINGEHNSNRSCGSVSLSFNGQTLAIKRNDTESPDWSAIGVIVNISNCYNIGYIRVYLHIDENPTWIHVGYDINGEADNELSGSSVSFLSGGRTIAIGMYNSLGYGSGHVCVYK